MGKNGVYKHIAGDWYRIRDNERYVTYKRIGKGLTGGKQTITVYKKKDRFGGISATVKLESGWRNEEYWESKIKALLRADNKSSLAKNLKWVNIR